MDCAAVRDVLVELPDGTVAPALAAAAESHAAGCAGCAQFCAALARVDSGLSRRLAAPRLDASFRRRLGARIAAEPPRVWTAWVPAAVHFASCGAATAVCLALLPDDAELVVIAAAVITFGSHFLLTAAQSALDAAGDSSL